MHKSNFDFRELAAKWPSAMVARQEMPRFTGGTYSERYLANLDCKGEGPAGRFRCGRRIVYPVQSVVTWLENRSTVVGGRNARPGSTNA